MTHWMTFDNRIIPMETMEHQHMSNIHHYMNVVI